MAAHAVHPAAGGRGGRAEIDATERHPVGCGPRDRADKDLAQVHHPAVDVPANEIRVPPLEIGRRQDASREDAVAKSRRKPLHLPLDASTRNLIDGAALGLMKPSAFLINNARGGIVDEPALKAALADRRLAGAAADVFALEPPIDLELLRLPTFIATPHIGGSTQEAVLAMGRAAIAGLDGGPESIDVTSKC